MGPILLSMVCVYVCVCVCVYVCCALNGLCLLSYDVSFSCYHQGASNLNITINLPHCRGKVCAWVGGGSSLARG